MSRRGWWLIGLGAAFVTTCACLGLVGLAGLWYLGSVAEATPPAVRESTGTWREIRTAEGRGALVVETSEGLPFQPGLFWYREPLPQPLNPLQYAGVIYLRLQQQNDALAAYDARWVSLGGWPAVQVAYAAVQQGQAYEGVLWIATDGWNGYVISFVAPYGTLATYAPDVPLVLPEVANDLFAVPGPLEGGSVPAVWTTDYWQSHGGADEVPAAWDWSGVEASAPLEGWENPYAGATWDGSPSDLWSDLPDVGSSVPYDSDHDAFNTWMAEEWSQMLSGENPEPTWQDEAGNWYWEGPSGTLHEWSADYDPSVVD
ncbi:MAG: hypothetical protein NZL87_05620 [Thermomicrobium sp.]|nr:hypothetical protein [Thermomicrobium sp.]MDW7982496.1 hypothetical protein [Thermomicrobium sp.]